MTLSSSSMANDNRSNSPNSSPRTSPKPSPRPHNKRDHSKSDTYLSVNFKETMPVQKGGGDTTSSNISSERSETVSIRGGASSEQLSPGESNKTETCSKSGKDKKDGRVKKKSAWYSGFYPTYKSRSGDYRQIFKDVPDDERLVVDYSCALQKEILVQGRLYVSQNYLCFYANIFGWETNVSFKWKEVTAITKEKTALVIPNAILIAVKDERFFFTSFVAREKTYMMLFRVWQNALMDKPMNQQEMWQLVHDSYGAELGLTSEDEDYIAPGTEDEKLSVNFSIESYSEDAASNIDNMVGERNALDAKLEENYTPAAQTEPKSFTPFPNSETKRPTELLNESNQLPTDMSDSSDSEKDKIANVKSLSLSPRSSQETNPNPLISSDFPDPSRSSSDEKLYPVCTALHEGRQLLNEVIPLNIDQLFTLLFTSSKFFLDFHASRKTADLTQTTWTHNPSNGTKNRIISLTVALNQTVGPKTAQVTETQVMLTCSKAGFLYSIDVETINAGIPYADSFCILVHYCLHRITETQSSIAVYAEIKYKKTVWPFIKGMIEKNCWSGLEDFFTCLGKALLIEAEEMSSSAVKRKSRKRRLHHSKHRKSSEEIILPPRAIPKIKDSMNRRLSQSNFVISIVFAVLILLVVLNILLYYKLWSLEETTPPSPPVIDLQVLKDPPKSHEDWLKLLQKQEMLHSVEMQKWARVLNTAIKLLKQTEESLVELQRSIQPTYKSKIMSIVESHQTTIKFNDSKEL